MDVISQEEFDSQRGIDDKESDQSDSDLVFSLDLQDTSKEPAPPTISVTVTKDTSQTIPKQTSDSKEKKPRVTRSVSPSKTPAQGGSSGRSKKEEKLARFYPVPNKQDSPSKVSVHVYRCMEL